MLEAKVIKARIAKVGKLAATVQSEIHVLACSIVGHALQHGDVTLADTLLAGVGKGVRAQALVTWFETFGPFSFKTKEGTFGLHKDKRAEMGSRAANAVVEELEAGVTWFDYTKESVKSTYDVEKMVEGILRTAASKLKKGELVLGTSLMADLHEVCLRHKLREVQSAKAPAAPAEAATTFGTTPELIVVEKAAA